MTIEQQCCSVAATYANNSNNNKSAKNIEHCKKSNKIAETKNHQQQEQQKQNETVEMQQFTLSTVTSSDYLQQQQQQQQQQRWQQQLNNCCSYYQALFRTNCNSYYMRWLKYSKVILETTTTATTTLTNDLTTTTTTRTVTVTEPPSIFTDMQRNHLQAAATAAPDVARRRPISSISSSSSSVPLSPTTTTTTTSTSLPSSSSPATIAKSFSAFVGATKSSSTFSIWLLSLLCLVAFFGCGQAGFACLSNPCIFGVCIDGLNSSYSCYCIDGYTGIQCQTNWDECWSGPCQNGGTCLDGVAYYNCTCPEGFSGQSCEENVDECMSNPCQHNGICRDGNNGYTCRCQMGFSGLHCEEDVSVCVTEDDGHGAFCHNGGECIEGPGIEYECKCTPGWTGMDCEVEINECESAPCQNGGVCVDKLAGYVCACAMGYTGTNCEEEIHICADNPCQNNALCLMEEGVPTCYCVPDYHGLKCEFQYDECKLGPRCMNGGVCIDGVDTFSCSCPPQLTGMLCECLMIGEDSLDCNYTAPKTWLEPSSTIRPEQPIEKPAESTTVVTIDASVSVSSEEVPETPDASVEIAVTTSKPVSSVSEESGLTTEASISFVSVDSQGSPETAASPETSGSVEVVSGSDEYTTISRFDISASQETTTKATGVSIDSDISPVSQSAEGSTSSDESGELPSITISAHIPTSASTIETSILIGYSTPRPTWGTPIFIYSTMVPGLETPDGTIKPILSGTYPPTPLSPPAQPTEYPDYHDQTLDISTTHRAWPDISTTAAPFFTEYPEVYVTTRYHDFISKDLSTGIGGVSVTTHLPPLTPPYYATTIPPTPFDYETVDITTATPARTPTPSTESGTQHIVPQITTHGPQAATTSSTTHLHEIPPITESPPPPHAYGTTPTVSVQITTTPPLYTDDLISPQLPVATTAVPLPPLPTTTEGRRPIITYVPPTQPEVVTAAAPTLPPQTVAPPVYSTYPPPPITKPLATTASSSSEEVEGANTVATGIGAAGRDGDNATDVDCLKLGCYNGGTCVTTSEGSRCVCRFDRQGALCEAPIVIRNAAFSGDSYVSHRIHKDIPNHESLDSVLPMHVQLKVRTRATNGLIMLAAAQGTKGGHYMALFLQKGLLQFQFSCGLQTMLLSELETPVNTGNEITIRAELDFSRNYTHCNASLLVNDTLAMSGDQPTWLKLLPARLHTPEAILNTWLHLGGAPQAPIGLIIELPPAQSGTGFTGCLHSLRINEETREIFGDALDGFGITECGSLACLSSPCRNGAACIKIESNEVDESGDKIEKWKCKCPTGYMGPTCEISVCEDNPCQYGGTCVQFPGSGYLCLCPLGKHGHYCEHNLEVALPSFSGSVNGLSSFVAYTVPIPLEYSIELSFKILPQTMSQISLLAFLGQSGYHDEKSDHLAVSFIQGYIMLTWNLGGGPRRIFTQKPIDFRLDAPRVPYEIKVGRIGRQAWLSVDGKFNITGRSPGSTSRMDVIPILYLGGHEISNFNTLPHDLPLHSGFQGCIYDVHLKAGQVTVPLQETRGVRGRGVGQCGTRECHRHACQHDGACLQHGATFTCICQEGWYGPLCAQPTNPCDSFNNKCSEDSTCVPLVNGYECDCPVGKTGKNCEEDIRSLSDVSLTGRRSYLAVRWPYVYDNTDKIGSKRSQMVSYRNFTKKLMPPKPISSPSQHFVMKLLNEVEKQRSFSPVPLMGSKSFEETHRVQFFFIEFQLRPLSERGLLLYFGTLNNNLDKKIGYVSLSLQGGVVEFRISGPTNHVTVVRSVRMLAIGEWHKIKMAQRGRWLTLWVEGSASSALAPSAEVLVEPDSLLYIGGLKDLSKLPHNAISGFPVPFRGCVRGLVVSGTRIVLNETNILESRNIRDCDGTACGGDSCESGGHCWLDEKLQPHCICPEYAKGDRCEYSETCKLIPCKNNGRCLRSGRCSCPNGWGGFYCEIAMSKPTTPSFRGNSYLVLPPPRIPIKDKRKGPSMYMRPREAIQITLNFSTIEPDGLLLWSEHDRAKFLGLGLENGHLKIASNLLGTNNDTVAAPSSGFIADGGWHMSKVILDRARLELQLDGEVIFAEKLPETLAAAAAAAATAAAATTTRTTLAMRRGKEPSITYEDVFYLGGFPNMESVSTRTRGRFFEPFKGCLQDIQFGVEPSAVISDFSTYQGENIGSCDLHGDEPIIV